MNINDDLNDIEALALIQDLAAAHPDFPRVAHKWASLTKQPLPADEQSQLVREALNILTTDPEKAQLIQAMLNNPELRQFDQKRSRIPILIALILVLGVKVEFDHNADGNQSFHFEYDASNAAVTLFLKKMEHFLPKP